MSMQANYCRDEWNLILGGPGLITLVIIQTEQCSLPVAYAKVCAVMDTIAAEAAEQGAGRALIQAVLDAVRNGQSPLWPTECPRDLGDIEAWALQACRQVAALLGQRAPEAEAEAYARWLMHLAQRAARAPAHGAPADAGLAPYTARQRAALASLAEALELPLTAAALPAS